MNGLGSGKDQRRSQGGWSTASIGGGELQEHRHVEPSDDVPLVAALATAQPGRGATDEVNQEQDLFPAVDAQIGNCLIDLGVDDGLIVFRTDADGGHHRQGQDV